MALKELDRSTEEYLWVMETWLKVPGLTANESSLIRTMLESVNTSIADFDQIRRIVLQPSFFPTLWSAMQKANQAGVLIEWSEYDQRT